ncbi:PIN domain-containing protein [Mesorhizobium sp. M1A.F.Ca.IN.020.06.1.1]|nr:PIN domain-containing protein [Mesorhizobium sp. M1A.F.Ca.IN.020.32.1.1]RUW05811.1 PIN domain-containing protein [Mesorhizobium sp. M1A.F.Ca.IN.022.05.2.1]RUW26415.1 PIN domain-containing protein [Mesorhizobium sp. M1A.F.Ca.IN.020.06.1.1]RWF82930.1 MAG: PIN domain-containing protein [Mesorhizobium sp.]RWG05719.1 MAG: PIN domain-containing protein [Mesorhizobium sp.]
MTSDLRAALRRFKPERRKNQLKPRPQERLVAVADIDLPGRPMLVPDTNVYIMFASGQLPNAARALIERSLLFHCSVCLGELATGVANFDSSASAWRRVRDHYATLFDAVPATRLLTPDSQLWIEAGVIAGILARTQNFQPHQRKECLNDALIYLTAARSGLPVLTANRDEFDLIQQIAPDGQFVHL